MIATTTAATTRGDRAPPGTFALALVVAVSAVAACGAAPEAEASSLARLPLRGADDTRASDPRVPTSRDARDDGGEDAHAMAARVRAVAARAGVTALPPAPHRAPSLVALGEALFFDPILAGNRDISCATCHHPAAGYGDARVLPVGTAAKGTGPAREPGPEHPFVPRNAPPVHDLAQPDVDVLFWDGRMQRRDDGSFVLFDVSIAASGNLRHSFAPVFDDAASAQAMMPVMARHEMRGRPGEHDGAGKANELARIPDDDFEGIWAAVAARVTSHPGYASLLSRAFPGRPTSSLTFIDLARAIGAFEGTVFSTDDTRWDRFLAGDDDALTDEELRGAALFLEPEAEGGVGCVACHSGPRLTDQRFHNIGVRPIGRGPSALGFVDLGAALRSHVGEEASFAFRTPTLRHVTHTGPWMHNGAYTTLAGAVRHHLDAASALRSYDPAQLPPSMRAQVHQSAAVLERVLGTLDPLVATTHDLPDDDVAALLAFLAALESPRLLALREQSPTKVPSGLALVSP
jgi:cytochrome c peroxidase